MELKKSLIRDQVYDIIKDKILRQEYAFGEKINLTKLMQELNVSNNPVREALSMLEKDGLIVIVPNAGSRVIEFNKETYDDLTSAFRMIFTGCYHFCVQEGRVPRLIDLLEEKINQQKKLLAAGAADYDFARASVDFDQAFLYVTENKRLLSLYGGIMDSLLLVALYEYQHENTTKELSVAQHEAMLQAIKEGDHGKAIQLINSHYNNDLLFEEK